MPSIADAPAFGGIGKMKESPRIRGHSNSLKRLCMCVFVCIIGVNLAEILGGLEMAQFREHTKALLKCMWKGIESTILNNTHCECQCVTLTHRELLEFKCKIVHFQYIN